MEWNDQINPEEGFISQRRYRQAFFRSRIAEKQESVDFLHFDYDA